MFRLVKSNWATTVLVCSKCSDKLDGGFGKRGRTPLHKALRKLMGKGRKAEIGIVPVKCLGVCPRGAVTMIDSRKPREWLIVPAGTAVDEVVAALAR